MHTIPRTGAAAIGLLALAIASTACSVKVSEGESGRSSDVEIRTPAGELSVRSLDDAQETGLATYPGAWPASGRHDRENASVNIRTAWFGVDVAAAKFETDDDPARVIEFYRRELERYGEVTECRGDVNFRGRRGVKRPVCREASWSRDVELLAGSENRQHVVAVKPHGDYTEFALVSVSTRAD